MQHLISIGMVLFVSTACYFSESLIGYKVVALILLMTVSILAILFDILPVMISAIISALIWNYFFIPPLYTFHITSTEDLLMFLMYFLIALINAALTYKIREQEKKARDKEEKENTIRLYNTLLNSLSHELRTPVTTIIGAVDTLKENRGRISHHNQEELLKQIDLASMRLNGQVENLLNMSRLETGMLQLHPDWCDLNELIYGLVDKFRDVTEKRIIIFIANEKLPLFKLDARLIEQAFYNIINNAIQYTPDGSTIGISAELESGKCVITITDNGKGFPENEIQFAFDKFYRLPHTQSGGSGLGLSISKGFIEAHNGSIKLENNPGGGAKFTIIIPAKTSFLNNLNNE